MNDYIIGYRVQIPAYTDAWMRGERYGTVTDVKGDRLLVFMDASHLTRQVLWADCIVYEREMPIRSEEMA